MNAVIYVLVAALAAVLAGRATYRGGSRDPLRRTFAVLCALTALTYTSFSLYLFPALSAARFPFAVAGAFLPVATLQFIESFFARQGEQPTPLLRKLWVATPIVAIGYLAADLVLFRDQIAPGYLELGLGLLVYAGFGVNLYGLWRRHEASHYRVEKARIRYLLGFMAAAVGFSGLEGADRILTMAPDAPALPLLERSVELQGHLPPIGALFAGLFLFFLYQVLSMERLLDLTEIFSRIVTVAATATALVMTTGIAVLWFAASPSNPLQTLFHLFVASVLFLLAYDPIRHRIQAYTDRWFNIRGHQLSQALDELDLALPKIISMDDLSHTLLERLHSSGRVPALSLYVYEPERNQVRLVAQKASGDHRPMPTVALHPFSEGFEAGVPAYVREHLERRNALSADRSDEAAARLRIMDGLDADLVVPMRTGELVLGWLAVRDEEWSDGFSQEEITRMARTMTRAAIVVENIKGFEAAKERSRLAVLGTMSAGLAHEIRNPLAGIKGAAQYLQTLDGTDEAQEFLQIITQETDRLNAVVSSFLDYARHFELHRAPTDVSELIAQVLKLVRAQGVPDGVTLSTDLATDLVPVPIDGDKVRQVVLNLVQNAIQALPSGGNVHVSTSRGYLSGSKAVETRAVVITVADDGPGIAPEVQDKLFIPFFTTKHGGTGLGLAICQRILKAHGGELAVESRPGAGAAFMARLPVPTPLQVTER